MVRIIIIALFLIFAPCCIFGLETNGKIETGFDPWEEHIFVRFNIGIPLTIGKMTLLPYFGNELWADIRKMNDIKRNIISNEYKFGANVLFDNFYIGIEHRCFHPQESERDSDWNTVFKTGVSW